MDSGRIYFFYSFIAKDGVDEEQYAVLRGLESGWQVKIRPQHCRSRLGASKPKGRSKLWRVLPLQGSRVRGGSPKTGGTADQYYSPWADSSGRFFAAEREKL